MSDVLYSGLDTFFGGFLERSSMLTPSVRALVVSGVVCRIFMWLSREHLCIV